MKRFYFSAVLILLISVFQAFAQTTAFNYQGRLTDGGNAANGNFLMQFRLWDAAVSGVQIGTTINDVPITAANGIFNIKLDFGSNALSGANRWLEISVRRNLTENYVTLSPREQIASSPYAVRTLSAQQADTALDAQKLGGINANEYVTNSSVGSSFIRNGTTLQTGNFNISGNGFFGGAVGIGTSSPLNTLDVNGTFRALRNTSNDVIVQTSGGTNSWARFWMISPNRSWTMGTSQNFNGDQFYLTDATINQPRFMIQPNGGDILFPVGNTGFGTTTPQTKMDVRGNLLLDNGTNPILFTGTAGTEQNRYLSIINSPSLQNASGLKAGGLLVSDSYDFANPSKNDLIVKGSVGIGAPNPQAKLQITGAGANGFGLGIDGNVTQNRDKGGIVKAMVYLNGDGTIIRCYNGFTGSTTGNCGFSSGRADLGSGSYLVNFGFQVSDRFWSVTVTNNVLTTITSQVFFVSANTLRMSTYENGTGSDRPLMVIIF